MQASVPELTSLSDSMLGRAPVIEPGQLDLLLHRRAEARASAGGPLEYGDDGRVSVPQHQWPP